MYAHSASRVTAGRDGPVCPHLDFTFGPRLGDVVERAQHPCSFPLLRAAQRGEHENRCVVRCGLLFQRLQGRKAIHDGHHHIHQNQIGLLGYRFFDRLGAIGGLVYRVPGISKCHRKRKANIFLIIDYEYPGHGVPPGNLYLLPGNASRIAGSASVPSFYVQTAISQYLEAPVARRVANDGWVFSIMRIDPPEWR